MSYVMENVEEDAAVAQRDLLSLAFSLGWATADESHLSEVPEALASLLDAAMVRFGVSHWNGNCVVDCSYPPEPEAPEQTGSPLCLEKRRLDLGAEYRLQLAVGFAGEMSRAQRHLLDRAVRLIHQALTCVLVAQQDPAALGEPFTQLSEREWKICVALEKPDGEKQIAAGLECSRHTLHSYVKGLYRKLHVQSRLQALHQLQAARERVRRRAMQEFGNKGAMAVEVDGTFEAPGR